MPDLQSVKTERENELALHDVRNSRTGDEFQSDWKNRSEVFDDLYAGRWMKVWPDEFTEQDEPLTGNIVQVGSDDMASLVAESAPMTRIDPRGDDQVAIDLAYLEEQIAQSYWDYNEGDELLNVPLAYDLIGPGAAFVAVTKEKDCEYPVYTRLNPRGCYPTWVRGKLHDLLVVTRMKPREAEATYGFKLDNLFSSVTGTSNVREIEILDFYTKTHVHRSVGIKGTDGKLTESRALGVAWEHKLGRVPVAATALWGGDGAVRGLFDQTKGILWAQNRLMSLIVDYADQEVYSPWFAYDIINDRDLPGPKTVYRGRTPDAKIMRVAPAGSNPQLFAVLEYLERQARTNASYPAQRQGHVDNSIASAAFVDRTLGQMATTVKKIQRKVAFVRRQLIELAFAVDREHLDVEKPLLSPILDRTEYKPGTDVPKVYRCRVLYGAGAGLDALNKKNALHMDLSAGVISLETTREQTEYLLKPAEEGKKRAKELVADALLQRLVTDPNAGLSTLMRFGSLLEQGRTVLEAADMMADLQEKEEREAAAAQQGAGGGVLEQGAAPPSEEALARGAMPPEASQVGLGTGKGSPVRLPSPPTSQVIVRPPSGG